VNDPGRTAESDRDRLLGADPDSATTERGERVAAFFDVDGTLLTVQSGTLYIGFLRRNGLMDLADQLRIYWAYLTYRLGVLNMQRLAAVTSRWLRDREEREVMEHCRAWYEGEVQGFFCGEVVDRVREHHAAGHVVALLTGGTHYLNDHIAADLGIEHVLASELEVVDGRFTGRPIPPLCYGKGKIHHAETFAAEHGIDLASSFYYADSITDLPMLETVGHPRAVNPDPRLRIEARRRGWTVVDAPERIHLRHAA
jgi:HAD superfamily hydrolase (TIGR01490 family)